MRQVHVGEALMARGLITAEQLEEARLHAEQSGLPVARMLIELDFVTEAALVSTLAEQLGLEFIDLANLDIDASLIRLIPEATARRHTCFPVRLESDDRLVVAIADPASVMALDDIRMITGREVKAAVATRADVISAIDLHYTLTWAESATEGVDFEVDDAVASAGSSTLPLDEINQMIDRIEPFPLHERHDDSLTERRLSLETMTGELNTRRRWGRKVPTNTVDCTVFGPTEAMAGDSLLVQVFIHPPEQSDTAETLAQEFDVDAKRRGFASLDVEISEGARLCFELLMAGLVVDEPVQTLVWLGRPTSVQFGVLVPDDMKPGAVIATARVTLEGRPIGHIKFKLVITRQAPSAASQRLHAIGDVAHTYQKAFISYAHKDFEEVRKRVQMLMALRQVYFQDVRDLLPGDPFERVILTQIEECDLFVLFWSSAAQESEWVMKEIRHALARKAQDEMAPPEIVPVAIEGPPIPSPPAELAHLHFGS